IRKADEEIRDHEGRSSIEPVRSLLDEDSSVFEKCGYVGNRHEGHERRTKELEDTSAREPSRQRIRSYD
ncbi:hypothetical protein FGG08_007292, partial [Glutinoglossum americanum]